MIKSVYRPACEVPLFLSDFNETWICKTFFPNNTEISNFMKLRPVRAELFHADGQTDITKLIVVFRNFANAPKYGFINEKVSMLVT